MGVTSTPPRCNAAVQKRAGCPDPQPSIDHGESAKEGVQVRTHEASWFVCCWLKGKKTTTTTNSAQTRVWNEGWWHSHSYLPTTTPPEGSSAEAEATATWVWHSEESLRGSGRSCSAVPRPLRSGNLSAGCKGRRPEEYTLLLPRIGAHY